MPGSSIVFSIMTSKDRSFAPRSILTSSSQTSQSSPHHRISGDSEEDMYLCMEGHGRASGYSILRWSPQNVTGGHTKETVMGRMLVKVDDELPMDMGCGRIGTKVFFVGGRTWIKASLSDTTNEFFCAIGSPKVWMFETAGQLPSHYNPSQFLADNLSLEEAPSMKSGKRSPVVVEVGGQLYVMSGSSGDKKPLFEVYHPATRKWEELPSPPLRYTFSKACVGFAVVDRMIHVSGNQHSHSFDIDLKKWSPCQLFPECGRPFEFTGPAVTYKRHILLCVLVSGVVAAYLLKEGKVVKEQYLSELLLPCKNISSFIGECSSGRFCIAYSLPLSKRLSIGEPVLMGKVVIITFAVEEIISVDSEKFVGYKVISRDEYRYVSKDTDEVNCWTPVGCFAASVTQGHDGVREQDTDGADHD